MSYIVKDKDNWLLFDRFVRDMDIITTVEPVSSYLAATEFDDEDTAKLMIHELEVCQMIDVSEYTIHDKKEVEEKIKQEKLEKERAILRKAWENTSEAGRHKQAKEILDARGEEALKEFLKIVDPTYVYSDDVNDNKPNCSYNDIFSRMEKMLGRPLTDEEKQNLRNE